MLWGTLWHDSLFLTRARQAKIPDAHRGVQGNGTIPEMLDNARMTIASRCHQHPVRHLRDCIYRIPRELSHVTISLPARSNWPRQGPIAALATRKKRIEVSLRNPATAERQRSDSGMKDNFTDGR